MVSELGHFLLISAFCLNLGLIANCLTRNPVFWGLAVLFNRLESLLLTLLAISFLFLVTFFMHEGVPICQSYSPVLLAPMRQHRLRSVWFR